MALDGSQLRNECVGYMRRLGILFFGFMDAMHRIGCNAALLCMLTCAYSVQLTEGRINCATTAIRTMNTLERTPIDMVAPTDSTDSRPHDITREYDWTLPKDAELEKEYIDYGKEQGDMNVMPPLIRREDLYDDDDDDDDDVDDLLSHQMLGSI